MPRRERERFGPWLIRQINSNEFDGVRWLGDSRTLFRLPWKHFNMRSVDEKDYRIFKAWAICSGKYNPNCEDISVWKTNFRCALNQVPYQNIKMFSEYEDHSGDQRDPHKIYKFNGVHPDLPASNPNAATCNESPSNLEEQSLLSELNDDDYVLHISPDCVLPAPFTRPEESEIIEELMRNFLLDSTENSIEQVLKLSQDEYPQGDPHVDQVFRPSTHEQWEHSQAVNSCVANAHQQALHEEPSIHVPGFHNPSIQYQACNIYQNGYPQNVFQQMPALPQLQHPPTVLNGLVPGLHELQVVQHNGYKQESAQSIVSNVIQNGFQQDASGVDQVINPSSVRQDPPLLNGPTQSFVQETQNTPLNQCGAHDISYKTANNGCLQDATRIDQGINSSPNYSHDPTNEEYVRSSPVAHDLPLVNGSGQASATETQATLLNQQTYGNSDLGTRENKMAESNAIFTVNESRGVVKFLFLQGKSVKDIHGDMSQTLGDQCPSYSTVKNWVAKFKMDHFSANNEERPGRPREVVVSEIVDAVHNLILENRPISGRMPPVTSWEVTIYYRGREVLKKNVSKNFLITSDIDNAQVEHTDTVQFPSTDVLVNHLQIQYTDNILSCVGQGLFIEVNTDNYKVYATRMGKSRVFWSLSESLETPAKMLIREVPIEIFDFHQFWEELKGYKYHGRSSPDYTIYMAFGQILSEPIMRKFVVVKLVPNICTFLHQAAQQSGASSLNSEVVSLQISNGSSLGSFDDPCFMELDFQDLL
ncbi:interferon regulatory factor 3-like isoform X1 [Eleutherodactylus coqui]|uniref:interferon regulatory factor 3-like isoform X1 n=1 Tax=Eleutherodactylus coqui TaxID=57060 RepID=UPI003462CFE8